MTPLQKIKINIEQNGLLLRNEEIEAYVFGDIAVHLAWQKSGQSKEWVLSSVAKGLKFPGSTVGLKAAIECAKEIDAMDFDWSMYDKTTHHQQAEKAKTILAEWGIVKQDMFFE